MLFKQIQKVKGYYSFSSYLNLLTKPKIPSLLSLDWLCCWQVKLGWWNATCIFIVHISIKCNIFFFTMNMCNFCAKRNKNRKWTLEGEYRNLGQIKGKLKEHEVAMIGQDLFFLPVLLRCNWHTALCEFKVYSITMWLTYIMKWWPQWV